MTYYNITLQSTSFLGMTLFPTSPSKTVVQAVEVKPETFLVIQKTDPKDRLVIPQFSHVAYMNRLNTQSVG